MFVIPLYSICFVVSFYITYYILMDFTVQFKSFSWIAWPVCRQILFINPKKSWIGNFTISFKSSVKVSDIYYSTISYLSVINFLLLVFLGHRGLLCLWIDRCPCHANTIITLLHKTAAFCRHVFLRFNLGSYFFCLLLIRRIPVLAMHDPCFVVRDTTVQQVHSVVTSVHMITKVNLEYTNDIGTELLGCIWPHLLGWDFMSM